MSGQGTRSMALDAESAAAVATALARARFRTRSRTATDKVRNLPRLLDNTKRAGVAAGSAGLPSCSSCLFIGLDRPKECPIGKERPGDVTRLSVQEGSQVPSCRRHLLWRHMQHHLCALCRRHSVLQESRYPGCSRDMSLYRLLGTCRQASPLVQQRSRVPSYCCHLLRRHTAAPPLHPAPGPPCAAGTA